MSIGGRSLGGKVLLKKTGDEQKGKNRGRGPRYEKQKPRLWKGQKSSALQGTGFPGKKENGFKVKGTNYRKTKRRVGFHKVKKKKPGFSQQRRGKTTIFP